MLKKYFCTLNIITIRIRDIICIQWAKKTAPNVISITLSTLKFSTIFWIFLAHTHYRKLFCNTVSVTTLRCKIFIRTLLEFTSIGLHCSKMFLIYFGNNFQFFSHYLFKESLTIITYLQVRGISIGLAVGTQEATDMAADDTLMYCATGGLLCSNKSFMTVSNISIICCTLCYCARLHICYSAYMLSPVRLSVRLSVTRVIQSKTVEVRIMQLSPQSSPMTLVSSWLIISPRNSKGNIGSGDAK